MDQSHLGAVRNVDSRGEGGRSEHGDEGHAVHVVGNRFTAGRRLAGVQQSCGGENVLINTKSTPSFSLGGLKALQDMEEGDWRG